MYGTSGGVCGREEGALRARIWFRQWVRASFALSSSIAFRLLSWLLIILHQHPLSGDLSSTLLLARSLQSTHNADLRQDPYRQDHHP